MPRSSAIPRLRAVEPEVRAARVRAAAEARGRQRDRVVFFGLYVVFVFLSVAFVLLSVGPLPVRGLYGVALGALLALSHPTAFGTALRKHVNLLLVILAFAVLGAVAGFLQGEAASVTGRQLMEIHVQAAVNLLVAATILEVCGPKALVKAFLGIIVLTSLVAIAQGLGIGAAWRLRALFGSTPPGDVLENGGRALGFSLTKVVLGTQVCLAFAMLYMYRQYSAPAGGRKGLDPVIVCGALAFVAVCVACGNRSPLLGMAIFLLLYATMRLGPMALVFGLLIAAVIPFVPDILAGMQGNEVRAIRVGDKSSSGRWPLMVYGWRLFVDQPFGYGLGFDPTLYWTKHWTALADIYHADIIQTTPLHNHALNTLNKYGMGSIFAGVFVAFLSLRHRQVLLGFIPYVMHVLFHNEGPMGSDFLIWLVLPLSAMGMGANATPSWRGAALAPWRRPPVPSFLGRRP